MMDFTLLTAILVGAGCLAFGYLIGSRYPARLFLWKASKGAAAIADGIGKKKKKKKNKPKETLEIEKLADILEDFKMVLVVRNDLKMGKGKIAAQCSHATLGLFKKIQSRAPKALDRWDMCGQVKVVVKIESEEHLLGLQEMARSLHLPTHVTIDAGRTQIAPSAVGCGESLCQKTIIFHVPVVLDPRKREECHLLGPTDVNVSGRDAGGSRRSPIDSRTVMAVLGPADMADDVTGGLKLL